MWGRRDLSAWTRVCLALLPLGVGAVVLALLAAREADRARRTADVLLRDYASFIADRLVERASLRYRSMVGLSGFDPDPLHPTLVGVLSAHAQAWEDGRAPKLPLPPRPEIRYLFAYEAATHRLDIAGEPASAGERRVLLGVLERLDPGCGPNQTVPMSRLVRVAGARAAVADSSAAADWSALVKTDARGAARAVLGFRLDEDRAVRSFLVPLVSGSDCDCVKELLPQGLSSVPDAHAAASFLFRTGDGRVLYRSEPWYEGANKAIRALSDLPLPGLTAEVAVNLQAVRPLLPYGGRDAPWTLIALLVALVAGSSFLAVRSLRRQTDLMRLREDFISNVSHELKTPLARIRLFNELLTGARQANPERQSYYRRVIERECRRLGFLVDNVLDFARLERSRRPYDRAPVDLRRLTEEALESFRAVAEEGRFKLVTRLADTPPVPGDPRALAEVVVNLLDNAVKYSPETAPVEVRLWSDDSVVSLAVTDHGCGIPEEERERIFEPFYRVESGDAQRVAGSGLGLALVRRTVEAHGGRVEVQSRVGEGSTFVVRLPLVAPPS